MMKKYKPSRKVIEFIKANIKGTPYKAMVNMINEKFKLNLSFGQVKGILANNNFTNGRDMKFKKGQESWNKGRKGIRYSPATEFKRGNVPQNYKPVGSERIDSKDGYVLIKVEDPNKWRLKHVVIWEKENGPLPAGHCVIFADGDKLNISLDNLILITRAELLIMNKKGLIKNDPELTKTGTLIAKVVDRGNKKKKVKL